MPGKYLILHMPVIHKGYLDFLERINDKILGTYILEEKFLENLSEFKPDIASINSEKVKNLLEKIGFNNVSILSEKNIDILKDKEIVLINDEVSRSLFEKYFKNQKVEWQNVFLRWDKSKVLAKQNLDEIPVSENEFDLNIMREALKESEKSGDWWRQIGAVLIKDGQILIRANNKDLPSDHTPYQFGEVRDLFNTGERPDLANTIHAEQTIIAKAAKEGIAVKNASLYVTTFPCPVCAKLIAGSGIKNLYFLEGWSNFDAKKVLDGAEVKVMKVFLKEN